MSLEGIHLLKYQEYARLRPWKVVSLMDSDHRIIFMSMMTEWEVNGKWHKDDDTFRQSAQELSDCAAGFRPGHGMFVWILHTYQECCHPLIAGTTILKQGTLAQKVKKRQHSAQREHGVHQHNLQADRVGKHSLHPLRDQEVLG